MTFESSFWDDGTGYSVGARFPSAVWLLRDGFAAWQAPRALVYPQAMAASSFSLLVQRKGTNRNEHAPISGYRNKNFMVSRARNMRNETACGVGKRGNSK
ncbi:MAG: hypothetical protein ABFS23_05660 [Pseudomonadota bacterium]